MRHYQRGMSTYTMIFFVLSLGFVALFGFKAGMPIMDNWQVKKIVEDLANDEGVRNMSDSNIRGLLEKKFQVNQIRHISVRNDVEITHVDGVRRVSINYEVREPFVGNVDLVISFDKNTVDLPAGR